MAEETANRRHSDVAGGKFPSMLPCFSLAAASLKQKGSWDELDEALVTIGSYLASICKHVNCDGKIQLEDPKSLIRSLQQIPSAFAKIFHKANSSRNYNTGGLALPEHDLCQRSHDKRLLHICLRRTSVQSFMPSVRKAAYAETEKNTISCSASNKV